MSLFASARDGYAQVGWRRLLAVTLAFCLAPAVMGGLGMALLHFSRPGGMGTAEMLHWSAFATFAAVSPVLTWPVWAVIGAGAGLLLARGRYGALSAVLLGAGAGGAAGLLIDQPLAAPLGAVLATFHRFTLALLRPLAF